MEIVVRAFIIFFFLWIVTRAVGRGTLGELSTFQLLLYVTMGDMVQQAITQQDYSVTAGVLAVGTFAVLTVLLSYIKYRWPRTAPVMDGRPLLLIKDGEILFESVKAERLTLDDLMEAAREDGIRRFADVELAVLEDNGRISFFTRGSGGSDGAPEGLQAT
jgi:uncharacterized membrane protein YcaP (DUF421 family)